LSHTVQGGAYPMNDRFDLIVIGSGAAGLSVALAAKGLRVAILTRGVFGLDGASCWAQGGIAAAIGAGDTPAQHALDTINCGLRLNNKAAVRWLAESAPDVVNWLSQCGAQFDHQQNRLSLGREGAHSFPRIVHAGGDATGAEVMRALREAVQKQANIQVFEFVEAEKLLRGNTGVSVVGIQMRTSRNETFELLSPNVVLATGGVGQLFRFTTNPVECDGSGLALAHGVGASLVDLEFVQFHPTALSPKSGEGNGEQLPLITEALRGAGAKLVNDSGLRFMTALHEQSELAPRDVVARAVWSQRESGHHVYLDARHLGETLRGKFPTVFAACGAHGIDPRFDLIPVVPAAHYHMGGVKVDLHSMTTVRGLYAVGEVACTGVHGANRLASNSILEAVAFGRALGERFSRGGRSDLLLTVQRSDQTRDVKIAPVNEQLIFNRLRQLMWASTGIVRTLDGLRNTLEQLQLLERRCLPGARVLRQITVARLITEACLRRRDSLGSHYVTNVVHGATLSGQRSVA
jgi:L-aspartate oxidase